MEIEGKVLKAMKAFSSKNTPASHDGLKSIWYDNGSFYATDTYTIVRLTPSEKVDFDEEPFMIDPQMFDCIKAADRIYIDKDFCVCGSVRLKHIRGLKHPKSPEKLFSKYTREDREIAIYPKYLSRVCTLGNAMGSYIKIEEGLRTFYAQIKSEALFAEVILMPVRLS